MTNTLNEGDLAPQFSLKSDKDELVNLSDFKGKNVILYFYPKDNTPGCTTQAVDFTENLQDFAKLDAVILGVSKDSVKSHQNFVKKQNLQITLLSDEELQMIPNYGVWVEKNMYGKQYMGIERTTFLINKEQKITKIWRKVKAKEHYKAVLDELENI